MKSFFKQIISDFQEFEIPKLNPRNIEFPDFPPNVRKGFVLVGMRRSGKTWTLYQEIKRLLDSGVPKSKILFINFEDERFVDMKSNQFQLILDAYYESFPENVEAKELYFFFDEIHEIEGWEKFVRRLIEKESIQVYISGSSAKMLSLEIATSLRGRTISREVFPYNFREYLSLQDVHPTKLPSTKQKAVLRHHLQEFLRWGGFPESIGLLSKLHSELLQDYISIVIFRDIVERHEVKNVLSLRKLITLCLQNAATLISVNKMYNTFKTLGYAVSKDTLYQFMEYFEDAYCIFSVGAYDLSARKSQMKPKKIYPVDQGLISAFSLNPNFDEAARLESTVFSALRRKTKEIYYYQTESGYEVDFLCLSPRGEMSLYQVSLSLKDPETKMREERAMVEAMNELGLKAGTIITLEEEASDLDNVRCLPVWEFLLTNTP